MTNNFWLTTVLITALSASSTLAMAGDDDRQNCHGSRSGHHTMKGEQGKRGRMPSQAEMNREFSAEQIRTLNEARLIMHGNPNLKVGEVTATDNGYRITIVTKDNSLVEEREVAKNNMPMKRFNAIKSKMATRQQ